MPFVKTKTRQELGIKDAFAPQFARLYVTVYAPPRLGRAGQQVCILLERRHVEFIRELNGGRKDPERSNAALQKLLGKGSMLLPYEKDKRTKKKMIAEGFECWYPVIELSDTWAWATDAGKWWELSGIPYNAPLDVSIYNPIDTPHLVVPVNTTNNNRWWGVWFPRFHPKGFRHKGNKPMDHLLIEEHVAVPHPEIAWPPPPTQSTPELPGYPVILLAGAKIMQNPGRSKIRTVFFPEPGRILAEFNGWGNLGPQRWVHMVYVRRA